MYRDTFRWSAENMLESRHTQIYIHHFISEYTAYVAWSKVAGVKLGFWQPTHILSACKPLQSRVFLVEQLTVYTNINVWKYWYIATEPNHICVSAAMEKIFYIWELEQSAERGWSVNDFHDVNLKNTRVITHALLFSSQKHLLLIWLKRDSFS